MLLFLSTWGAELQSHLVIMVDTLGHLWVTPRLSKVSKQLMDATSNEPYHLHFSPQVWHFVRSIKVHIFWHSSKCMHFWTYICTMQETVPCHFLRIFYQFVDKSIKVPIPLKAYWDPFTTYGPLGGLWEKVAETPGATSSSQMNYHYNEVLAIPCQYIPFSHQHTIISIRGSLWLTHDRP